MVCVLAHVESVVGGKDKVLEVRMERRGGRRPQEMEYGDARGGVEEAERYFKGAFWVEAVD